MARLLRALLLTVVLLAPTASAQLETLTDAAPTLPTRREVSVDGVASASVSLGSRPRVEAEAPALDGTPVAEVIPAAVMLDAAPVLNALPLPVPLPEVLPAEDIIPDPFEEHRRSRSRERDPAREPPVDDAPPIPEEEALRPASFAPEPPTPQPLESSSGVATLALGVTALVAVLAALYSRLQKRALLLAPTRARLHEHVARAGSVSVAELVAATGLSRGAVVHHLLMLEKHGLLTSRHDGLHRRYALPGAREEPAVRPVTPAEARVLAVLRAEGALSQAELAARLGVSRQAVHEQVRRLQRDGRIAPTYAGLSRRWSLAGDTPAPRRPPIWNPDNS